MRRHALFVVVVARPLSVDNTNYDERIAEDWRRATTTAHNETRDSMATENIFWSLLCHDPLFNTTQQQQKNTGYQFESIYSPSQEDDGFLCAC